MRVTGGGQGHGEGAISQRFRLFQSPTGLLTVDGHVTVKGIVMSQAEHEHDSWRLGCGPQGDQAGNPSGCVPSLTSHPSHTLAFKWAEVLHQDGLRVWLAQPPLFCEGGDRGR